MKFKDASLPVQKRVDDLLRRMTLEEKIGQLSQELAWKAHTRKNGKAEVTDDFKKMLSGNGLGSLYGVLRADPWTGVTLESGIGVREGTEAVNAIQRFAIENTRLGIPLIFNEECSHGHMAIGGTVFPVPICAASSWNPSLLRQMTAATAAETRAQGGTATCSPVLDVVRDVRWGRTEETLGEDPFLIATMGAAAVRGSQGDDPAGGSLDNDRAIIATIKHFAAHGWPEGGHNAGPAHFGMRELREVCLAPFKACVEAGAESVMSAYSEIDGDPCSGSRWLLTDLLRSEWGFKGFVVSDMGAVGVLWKNHHVAPDLAHAGARALTAGVDVEMTGGGFSQESIKQALKEKLITVKTIDLAVRRILRLKFLLGLFENPYADPDKAAKVVHCAEHRQLAREVARQGIVLLKNENGILPLKKNIGSIAVIGPNANEIYNQLGDYTAPQPREKVASVLDGIRAAVSKQTKVNFAKGCGVRNPSKEGFAAAIAAAKASEVAVVVVGGSSARDFGQYAVTETGAAVPDKSLLNDMECGEGVDLASLELQGVQTDLLKEIHATGVPVIVVMTSGRPYAINWAAEHAAAIVEAWYPGQEGGHAVADVIFGDCNPAGRLPVSVPRSAAQLPVYYSAKSQGRPDYVDMKAAPLYEFGFGLSYTAFKYENLKIAPKKIKPNGTAKVSVAVTNTGKRAGDEVVQLYIRDDYASLTRPVRELKGFERISLQPGETKTVKFTLGPEQLQFLDAKMKPVVEPGTFIIMVGGNQKDVLTGNLEVKK